MSSLRIATSDSGLAVAGAAEPPRGRTRSFGVARGRSAMKAKAPAAISAVDGGRGTVGSGAPSG